MSSTYVRKALIPCGRKWTWIRSKSGCKCWRRSLSRSPQQYFPFPLETVLEDHSTDDDLIGIPFFTWYHIYHYENTAGRISPDYHQPDNLERQRRYTELFVTSFVRCTTSVSLRPKSSWTYTKCPDRSPTILRSACTCSVRYSLTRSPPAFSDLTSWRQDLGILPVAYRWLIEGLTIPWKMSLRSPSFADPKRLLRWQSISPVLTLSRRVHLIRGKQRWSSRWLTVIPIFLMKITSCTRICATARVTKSNHVVWTTTRIRPGSYPIPRYSLGISGHTRVRHTVQYTRHRLLILRVNCHLAAMTDLLILELLFWITFHNTESFQNPIALFIPTLSNHPNKFQSQRGTSLFVSFLIWKSRADLMCRCVV